MSAWATKARKYENQIGCLVRAFVSSLVAFVPVSDNRSHSSSAIDPAAESTSPTAKSTAPTWNRPYLEAQPNRTLNET